jgi:hypothetical protein
VTLWRVLPWDVRAQPQAPGGALWFPRELQGAGRHDNPDRYGCLYVSETPLSPVAEALAPFRGSGPLTATMLTRAGLPLALAELRLADDAALVDLDDPAVLVEERLRPSQVATSTRLATQSYAARLFLERPRALGLRWWSTLEASLVNLTLYDRAADHLSLAAATPLAPDHPVVRDAADLLGLAPTARAQL